MGARGSLLGSGAMLQAEWSQVQFLIRVFNFIQFT
jgi:hypothetical protein